MSDTHYPQLFCMTRYIIMLNGHNAYCKWNKALAGPDSAGIDPDQIKSSLRFFLRLFLE